MNAGRHAGVGFPAGWGVSTGRRRSRSRSAARRRGMAKVLDQLLDQFERGLIDRRQLLKGLALVTGGALGANVDTNVEAQSTAMLPLQQINHINLIAKDVKKTAEFYRVVFGAKAQTDT